MTSINIYDDTSAYLDLLEEKSGMSIADIIEIVLDEVNINDALGIEDEEEE